MSDVTTALLADWKATTAYFESWAAGTPEAARDPLFEDISDILDRLLAAVEAVRALHTIEYDEQRGVKVCCECGWEYWTEDVCLTIAAIDRALEGDDDAE